MAAPVSRRARFRFASWRAIETPVIAGRCREPEDGQSAASATPFGPSSVSSCEVEAIALSCSDSLKWPDAIHAPVGWFPVAAASVLFRAARGVFAFLPRRARRGVAARHGTRWPAARSPIAEGQAGQRCQPFANIGGGRLKSSISKFVEHKSAPHSFCPTSWSSRRIAKPAVLPTICSDDAIAAI